MGIETLGSGMNFDDQSIGDIDLSLVQATDNEVIDLGDLFDLIPEEDDENGGDLDELAIEIDMDLVFVSDDISDDEVIEALSPDEVATVWSYILPMRDLLARADMYELMNYYKSELYPQMNESEKSRFNKYYLTCVEFDAYIFQRFVEYGKRLADRSITRSEAEAYFVEFFNKAEFKAWSWEQLADLQQRARDILESAAKTLSLGTVNVQKSSTGLAEPIIAEEQLIAEQKLQDYTNLRELLRDTNSLGAALLQAQVYTKNYGLNYFNEADKTLLEYIEQAFGRFKEAWDANVARFTRCSVDSKKSHLAQKSLLLMESQLDCLRGHAGHYDFYRRQLLDMQKVELPHTVLDIVRDTFRGVITGVRSRINEVLRVDVNDFLPSLYRQKLAIGSILTATTLAVTGVFSWQVDDSLEEKTEVSARTLEIDEDLTNVTVKRSQSNIHSQEYTYTPDVAFYEQYMQSAPLISLRERKDVIATVDSVGPVSMKNDETEALYKGMPMQLATTKQSYVIDFMKQYNLSSTQMRSLYLALNPVKGKAKQSYAYFVRLLLDPTNKQLIAQKQPIVVPDVILEKVAELQEGKELANVHYDQKPNYQKSKKKDVVLSKVAVTKDVSHGNSAVTKTADTVDLKSAKEHAKKAARTRGKGILAKAKGFLGSLGRTFTSLFKGKR